MHLVAWSYNLGPSGRFNPQRHG